MKAIYKLYLYTYIAVLTIIKTRKKTFSLLVWLPVHHLSQAHEYESELLWAIKNKELKWVYNLVIF